MSTQKSNPTRQGFGEVEESPALRIDEEKAEQLIDALNQDVANAYVLYHQLKKHHWIAEGAEFRDLHVFLQEAYENVEEGSDMLAERAQAIGGVPISGMDTLEEHATVGHEGPDAYGLRDSLENDLELYGDIIEDLREHVKLANNLGDYTTEEILRDVLEDVEDDGHHIEHYLEDDTLVTQDAME
ncbi:MAG: DNA starvation/stationary phase protection protein DpsA [Halolamina sp.]